MLVLESSYFFLFIFYYFVLFYFGLFWNNISRFASLGPQQIVLVVKPNKELQQTIRKEISLRRSRVRVFQSKKNGRGVFSCLSVKERARKRKGGVGDQVVGVGEEEEKRVRKRVRKRKRERVGGTSS